MKSLYYIIFSCIAQYKAQLLFIRGISSLICFDTIQTTYGLIFIFLTSQILKLSP